MKALSKIVRKYYKFAYSTFEQPALTSDGKMGGSSFAVSAQTNGGVPNHGRGTAYGACYPQTGSYKTYSKGGAPYAAIILYTPKPTLITSVTYSAVWNRAGNVNVTFYAANNTSNWVTLYPTTSLAEGARTLTLQNSTLYQYYKLNIQTTGGGNHDGINISGVRLIGTERTIENGTADNYDYYVDVQRFSAPKIDGKYYCSKF